VICQKSLDDSLDILCSCTVLLLVAAASLSFGLSKKLRRGTVDPFLAGARGGRLPKVVNSAALWALAPVTRAMIALGISANAVTAVSLLLGGAAGALLAMGHFGVASLFFAAASLGDAIDGLVARATRTETAAGALFDASVDRYEEFFAFGGLAIFFRSSGILLAIMLLALVGAFMVSYGSAKAEALHIAVPAGSMRRAERAICLAIGTTLVPMIAALSARLGGPAWCGEVPVLMAIGLIAVSSNVSAVRRLRLVAAAVSPRSLRVERESIPRVGSQASVPIDVRASAK
jgi:CDP-diacylglycerol---glycerol-3-phosphate 3-phosphatidyltransferase